MEQFEASEWVVTSQKRGIKLDNAATQQLQSRCTNDVLNWFERRNIVIPQDAAHELINYLDRMAAITRCDGPTRLQTRLGRHYTRRCGVCLASPTTDHIHKFPHQDLRDSRFARVVRRLCKRKDFSVWLATHEEQAHFNCSVKNCQGACGNAEELAHHTVEAHPTMSVLPRNLPTPSEMLAQLRMMLSATEERMELPCRDVWQNLVEALESPGLVRGDSCALCNRSSGHDTRFCTAESRSIVATLWAKNGCPDTFSIQHAYKSLKMHKQLMFGSPLDADIRIHLKQECRATSIIVAATRSLTTLCALRWVDEVDCPVTDWRWHALAARVCCGIMTSKDQLPRFKPRTVSVGEEVMELQEPSRSWSWWLEVFIDTFSNQMQPWADHCRPVPTQVLDTIAEKEAVAVNTKLTYQLVPLLWKFVRGRLTQLGKSMEFLRKKGVKAKLLRAIKLAVISNQPLQQDVQELLSGEVETTEKDEFDDDDDVTVDPNLPAPPNLLESIEAILATVQDELLRNCPLGQLVDVTEKEGGIPKPYVGWQKWAVANNIPLNKSTNDTKAQFASLSKEQQDSYNAGVLDDFKLWTVADGMLRHGITTTFPKYSYMSKSYSEIAVKNGKWRRQWPSFIPGQNGEPKVEWVDQPFAIQTAGVDDSYVKTVVDMAVKGKRGFVGTTSTLAFAVHTRLIRAIERYNVPLDVQSPQNALIDQIFEIQTPSKVAQRNHDARVEKTARWASMDRPVPHVKTHQPVLLTEPLKNDAKEEKGPHRIKSTEPLLHTSLTAYHVYYDWEAFRASMASLNIQLPVERSWHVLGSLLRTQQVAIGSKRKRTSVAGPGHLGPRTGRLVYGFETDAFDQVWKVNRFDLIVGEPAQSVRAWFDLGDARDRDKLIDFVASDKYLLAFGDPGNRDIEKMMIPISHDLKQHLLDNPTKLGRLDDGIMWMDANKNVTIARHRRQQQDLQAFTFNAQSVNQQADVPQFVWDHRTKLSPDQAFILRGLPLRTYQQMAGFTKDSKARAKLGGRICAESKLSVNAIYKTMPTQKTGSPEVYLRFVTYIVQHLTQLIDFEQGKGDSFGFQPVSIRKFHRRKSVLDNIYSHLFHDPRTGRSSKNFIFMHGSADFPRGNSPGKLIKRAYSSKCVYVPVTEYHTSKICCLCRKQELCTRSFSRFIDGERQSKKLTWGVKRCPRCRVHFNRDLSACLNMGYCGLYALYNAGKRPPNFYSD